MESRFNLIDEPWVPVADYGRVSLRQIFSNPEYRSLGGNPVQKIALLKLLLAIAQAAATPKDEAEWQAMGAQGLADRCLDYLEKWHDQFYLYGDRPFLQIPAVAHLIDQRTSKKLAVAKTTAKRKEALESSAPKRLGTGFYPDLPSSNNTMLSHTQFGHELSDAEAAVFIVSIMNFAFGGKRVEGDLISLSGKQMGNRYSAPAGPSLGGWSGYLHAFIQTGSILNDVWINTLSRNDIKRQVLWGDDVGIPLWEFYPASEDCQEANFYRHTYMATLVSMSRFALLKDKGIFYTDGINYPSVKNGWLESSLIINKSDNEIKAKYVDPEKRPWRELESILSFIAEGNSNKFECLAIRISLDRARANLLNFSVWSGGLKVSSNSGDQSVKQNDDFVESEVWLHSEDIGGFWFGQLKQEMDALDGLAKNLYGRVQGFFKEQMADGSKIAPQATHHFWQLCERDFQQLVDACDQSDEAAKERQMLRQRFASYIQQSYDKFCARETARQLDAWAKYRPNNSECLKQEA